MERTMRGDAPLVHNLIVGVSASHTQTYETLRPSDCASPSKGKDVLQPPRATVKLTGTESRTILIVEDDPDICDALRLAFEDEGFHVESATDGLNALQQVQQSKPDLIVLDLNMPRMSGESFLYAWRTGGETSGVPVIVITAESQALRPQDLGVEAFFFKPFDFEKLLWHVKDLLAIPPQAHVAGGRVRRDTEIVDVADSLSAALSTLLLSVEQLADAPELSEDLRTMAATGLDAAQRASVLARRLNHLVHTLK